MEFILLFILLCLSKSNSYGIPPTRNVYRNQTWDEAANDSTCSMIGLNLKGEVEDSIDNVTSSIVLGKYQTVWIGAYAKRVWINFEGCYYGTFYRNHNSTTLKSQRNPARSCLRLCNYDRFVLVNNTCVCFNAVKLISSGCYAGKCPGTQYTYCGQGAYSYNNTVNSCMCRFSVENYTGFISGDGNCLTATYNNEQHHNHSPICNNRLKQQQQQQSNALFKARNCNDSFKSLCYDPHTKIGCVSRIPRNWLNTSSNCYNQNKQFAGSTTNPIGISNGTYWVGTFAVTYKLWGRPRTVNDSCVAVNIDRTNNHLTIVVLPCGTLLPVLCTNSSLPTSITTQGTILSTNHDLPTLRTTDTSVPGTTQGHYMTTISTNHLNEVSTSELQTTSIGHSAAPQTSPSTEKSTNRLSPSLSTSLVREASRNTQTHTPISVIVGSVVGTVVLLIFLVVIVLWRRGVFRKSPATRSNRNSDESEMRDPNREDNMCMTNGTHDNVYNHLGEITTRREPDEDLYDHTGADGGTYGHLNSGKHDVDSEYDHTFNHTTGDTYGHLNSSYMYRHDNDSEYDHTGRDTYGRLNEHNRQSGDDSNYDHTGNMYSHLNTGKYRDVVDDTYDHTGGLGNVYGHLNMSKPEEDNEYGHLNMS